MNHNLDLSLRNLSDWSKKKKKKGKQHLVMEFLIWRRDDREDKMLSSEVGSREEKKRKTK